MSRPAFWRVPRNRKEEEDFMAQIPRGHYDNKLSHEEAIIMKKSGDHFAIHRDGQSTPTGTNQKTNASTATLTRNKNLLQTNAEDAHRDKEVAIEHQPYRTTPLILPGAKVRRESLPTQSYLQMQSSSKLWNSSTNQNNQPITFQGIHHDAAYSAVYKPKEKVFDPMKGWRTDAQADQKENIEQSGSSGAENLHPKVYNPKQSETFRALMETETEQNPKKIKEVKNVEQKVRTAPNAPLKHVNLMGLPQEKIQQSYSFRRLMNDVLGETDF